MPFPKIMDERKFSVRSVLKGLQMLVLSPAVAVAAVAVAISPLLMIDMRRYSLISPSNIRMCFNLEICSLV